MNNKNREIRKEIRKEISDSDFSENIKKSLNYLLDSMEGMAEAKEKKKKGSIVIGIESSPDGSVISLDVENMSKSVTITVLKDVIKTLEEAKDEQ